MLLAGADHYQMLVDEADNLVIFLGAGANADDHVGPWRQGAAMLPDDIDLANYLAESGATEARRTDWTWLSCPIRPRDPRRAERVQVG